MIKNLKKERLLNENQEHGSNVKDRIGSLMDDEEEAEQGDNGGRSGFFKNKFEACDSEESFDSI